MKKAVIAAAIAYAGALAFGAAAQPIVGGKMEVAQSEAVVTITKIDLATRMVSFRGPRGEVGTFQAPAESQNLDRVKPGAKFKVKYVEAIALAVQRGGQPSAGVSETVKLAPRGANPGGIVTQTQQVAAVVDAIDYGNRYIAVRGPKGNTLALKVSDDVKLDQLEVGDRISLTYTAALAMEMIPQEKKAKPAAKKSI